MATSRVNRFSSKLKILNITFNCLYLVNKGPLLLLQVQNIWTHFRQKVLSGKEKYFYLDNSVGVTQCRKFLIKSDKLARHLQVKLGQDWAIIQPVKLYIYNYVSLTPLHGLLGAVLQSEIYMHMFSYYFNFPGDEKKNLSYCKVKCKATSSTVVCCLLFAVSEHFRAGSEALAELHGHFKTHL